MSQFIPIPLDAEKTFENSRGFVVEFNSDERCDSWILLPAENLWDPVLRAILYLVGLCYCFLGVAVVADVFMSSIEVITSKQRVVKKKDPTTGEPVEITTTFWNPTVANLSLIALGSSAPEILLATIETILSLGKPPGKLGPGTIVGSAAFNLLAITGISMMAIQKGQFRRIEDFGVFIVTGIFSIVAYVWMLIILDYWTEGEITVAEAVITLILFPILIIVSWLQDRKWFRTPTTPDEPMSNYKLLNIEMKRKEGVFQANKKTVLKLLRKLRKKKKNEEEESEDVNKETKMLMAEISGGLEFQKDADPLQYRIRAVRGLIGRKRFVQSSPNQTASNNLELDNIEQDFGYFGFTSSKYTVREADQKVVVTVTRTGSLKGEATVDYHTIDGTAVSSQDYQETKGTLTFADGETTKTITIPIIDDNHYEPDQSFEIQLTNPSSNSHIEKGKGKTEVVIFDSNEKAVLAFERRKYDVMEDAGFVELTVIRESGSNGEVTVDYETKEGTAKEGNDYIPVKGTIRFLPGEAAKTIRIEIVDDDIPEEDKHFYVKLLNPGFGAILSARNTAKVTIIDNDNIDTISGNLNLLMKRKLEAFKVATDSWTEQFVDALTLGNPIDEFGEELPPTIWDMVTHALSLPWKILFAFIPPTAYLGGWLTFIFSLIFIGAMTAVIAEFAELFGCVVGLDDTITAISIVALGTSLPDTFASVLAARNSSNADSSIGNITGSNSVNVFLGLGLPWMIGSIYYASRGEKYLVPSGDLAFSVSIFLGCAAICLLLLLIRRFVPIFRGELGGPGYLKYPSGFILVFLWLFYIIISSLRAMGDI